MKKMDTRFLLCMILILLLTACNRNQSNNNNIKNKVEVAFFESEVLFNPLIDSMGYHNYRIPSLLATQKGTLLAIMEGREGMNFDHAKNDIVLKRSTNNGANWSKPRVIAEAGDNLTMNPTIVQTLDGTIILTYIYLPENRHNQDRNHGEYYVKQVDPGLEGNTIEKVFMIKSKDDGQTWSEPIEITLIAKSSKNSVAAVCGPGIGVTLTKGKYKGRVIIPMSETILENENKIANNFALYSDDNGETWIHGNSCPASKDGKSGGNEVQMVELENGEIMASIRTKNYKLISKSRDGGQSWEPLQEHKELVDTGCMSPLLRYRFANDNLPGVIIHIGVTQRVNGRKRGDAIIALSYDDGKTWPIKKSLHKKEFDYSSLTILPSGTIGMLAEYDFNGERADIKFAKFNLEWIESKK